MAPLALDDPTFTEQLGLVRDVVPVGNCRTTTKDDLTLNTARPDVRVDPDTFAVTIDGELIEAAPAAELPMAQRYFLF